MHLIFHYCESLLRFRGRFLNVFLSSLSDRFRAVLKIKDLQERPKKLKLKAEPTTRNGRDAGFVKRAKASIEHQTFYSSTIKKRSRLLTNHFQVLPRLCVRSLLPKG
jgi:hypothetical protein